MQKDKEGVPQTGSKQLGTPKQESHSDNINVGAAGIGNLSSHPTLNPQIGGRVEDLNLDELKLTQDFSELIGTKKRITTVPVRKPTNQEYVRVRQGAEWVLNTCVIVVKKDNTTYVVDKKLWGMVGAELKPLALYTTMNRQHVTFLWPVPLPGPDGKMNPWHRSQLDAVHLAEDSWIRMASNRDLGAYECFVAHGDLPDPEWPTMTFRELFDIAFRDQFISDFNHPALRELRGEE